MQHLTCSNFLHDRDDPPSADCRDVSDTYASHAARHFLPLIAVNCGSLASLFMVEDMDLERRLWYRLGIIATCCRCPGDSENALFSVLTAPGLGITFLNWFDGDRLYGFRRHQFVEGVFLWVLR